MGSFISSRLSLGLDLRSMADGRAAGGAPPLDGLTPTGAWSASRKLLTAYAGSLYSLSSGAVATLYDQAGAGRDFAQATENKRPAIQANPVDGLLFDGAGDGLVTTAKASDLLSASQGYIIVSMRPTGFPSNFGIGAAALNSVVFEAENLNVGIVVSANSGSPAAFSVNYPVAVQSSITTDVPYVVEWRNDGSNLYQRVNGVEVSTPSSDPSLLDAVVRMGGNEYYFKGCIFEAATFNVVPDLTTRNALVKSFGSHIGAAISL